MIPSSRLPIVVAARQKIANNAANNKNGRIVKFLARGLNFVTRHEETAKDKYKTFAKERLTKHLRRRGDKYFKTKSRDAINQINPSLIMAHEVRSAHAIHMGSGKNTATVYDLVENFREKNTGYSSETDVEVPNKFFKAVSRADLIISGDPYLSEKAHRQFPKTETITVLNGPKFDGYSQVKPLREMIGDKTDRPIILFVGLVAKGRGIEELIEAVELVTYPCIFVIVGPGNTQFIKAAKEKILEKGRGDSVFFLGSMDFEDITPISATADICYCPVPTDSGNRGLVLTNKLMQYVGAAKPVITSDCPSMNVFLAQYPIGITYTYGDGQSLADAIDSMLSDKSSLNLYGQEALACREEISWQVQVDKLNDGLNSVLLGKNLKPARKSELVKRAAFASSHKSKYKEYVRKAAVRNIGNLNHLRINMVNRAANILNNQVGIIDKSTAIIDTHLQFIRNNIGDDFFQSTEAVRKGKIKAIDSRFTLIGKQYARLDTVGRSMRTNLVRLQVGAKSDADTKPGNDNTVLTSRLSDITDYSDVVIPKMPAILRNGGKPKVLLLNSIGGSMGRLSKALMRYENIEADCMVNAYIPKRHLIYAHETNVQGVFSEKEWKDYLGWALQNYDVIQSSGFPRQEGLSSLYDWVTEKIGKRHIWRSTGFVHHYMHREDILPLRVYQADLGSKEMPSPDKFLPKTFKNDGENFLIDDNVVFYSSPEKGAYFKGENKFWLPSMRNERAFYPSDNKTNGTFKIYVPYHKDGIFKGMNDILDVLQSLKNDGMNIEIVTPENATHFFPDLASFTDDNSSSIGVSYPIPNHMMPELMRRVDLVVDQLIMGCYGNTAIEAMMCGKPVVAQKNYADFDDAPIIEADLGNLSEVVQNLLENPKLLKKYGEEGREYALATHSAKNVAAIAAHAYEIALS